MEDDHVDRPDVEAQQCVKLTGTNRSFGLIALITQCPSVQTAPAQVWTMQQIQTATARVWATRPQNQSLASQLSFAGLVALARWPDPIPSRTRPSNASAPMVLCLKTWESRSPPGLPRTVLSRQNKPKGRASKRALSLFEATRFRSKRHVAQRQSQHPWIASLRSQ